MSIYGTFEKHLWNTLSKNNASKGRLYSLLNLPRKPLSINYTRWHRKKFHENTVRISRYFCNAGWQTATGRSTACESTIRGAPTLHSVSLRQAQLTQVWNYKSNHHLPLIFQFICRMTPELVFFIGLLYIMVSSISYAYTFFTMDS